MPRFLTAACLALVTFAALAVAYPATAQCQYYVSYYAPPAPVVSYYTPVVTTSYYAAPVYSYSFYAPGVSYYPAPAVSYYAAPAVSFYAAPAYTYRAPAVSYYTSYYGMPAATTSYYVRPGLFRPRVYGTTTYYTPLYYRY
jgi:hypothetical protein